MQKILPLLKDILIFYDAIEGGNFKNDLLRHMMEMLASKTRKLVICQYLYREYDLNNLNKFNKQYPGFIDGIQSICVYVLTEEMSDLLAKWLNSRREDGKMKMLEIRSHPLNYRYQYMEEKLIKRIKEVSIGY